MKAVADRCALLGGVQDVGDGQLGGDGRSVGQVLHDGHGGPLHSRFHRSAADLFHCDSQTPLPLRGQSIGGTHHCFRHFLQVHYQPPPFNQFASINRELLADERSCIS